ncbi:Cation/multidrug efflux pump, partial [gut metagenome]
LTVVPALGSTLMRTVKEPSHPLFEKLVDLYSQALKFCLRFKIVPLSLAGMLLLLCIGHTAKMGLAFMPSMGGNQMSATLILPKDTSREDAFALADTAMEEIGSIEGIKTVGATDSAAIMGTSSGNTVESISFYLILDEHAVKDNHMVAEKIRNLEQSLPGCELKVATSNADMSMLGGSGIELVIRGRDLDKLNQISQDMIDLLAQVEGLESATNGQEEGTEQLRLVIDADEAMRHGLTVAQIYSELSAALKTDVSSTSLSFENGDFEVTVVDERGALNRDNLLDYTFETTVPSPGGNTTESHRLNEFASLRADLPIDTIHRENQQRCISINAATREGYNTSLLSRQVRTLLEDYPLPEGFSIEIAGETRNIDEAMTDLIKMLLLAIAFIYLIMVAQFQSLLSPFIVMFTMPLAFTGGLGALWITGEPLSIIAMLGFLVLAGIVVNNGIVFVDYTNQLRLAGYGRREALVLAGKARIRPILMTALTTILAMSIMVFSKGMGAEMSRPMALVTIGGLAYATLLT